MFFLLVSSAWATDIGIYVANSGSDSVSVIDPATNTVTATVSLGASPQSVDVLPNGSEVYVASNGNETVYVIDTSNNTVSHIISVGFGPTCVAASPDGSLVLVTNQNSNSVSVINTSNKTVTDTITVGTDPHSVVINPAGTFAYVANTGDDSVSVIDLSSKTVTNTITLTSESSPRNLIVNHAGTKVYVTGFLTNKVYEITTSSNTVTNSVSVGGEALGLVLSADDATLYVMNALDNTVSEIATAAFTVSSTLTATNFPRQGILSSDQTTLYTTEAFGNSVSVINIAANTKTSIAVGMTPFDIAFARTTPALSLSATSLTFTDTKLTQTSASQTVTLTSTGTEDLAITSITATGDFGETNDCGTSLAHGSSCTVTVTFSPTTAGNLTGSIVITTNDTTSPNTITLAGTGSANGTANLLVTITGSTSYSADGSTAYQTSGQSYSYTFNISNTGADSFGASQISLAIDTHSNANIFFSTPIVATELNTQNKFSCSVTQASLVTPIVTCDLGTVSSEQSKIILLSVTPYTLDITDSHGVKTAAADVKNALIDATGTYTSGILSTQNTRGIYISGASSSGGCSLTSYHATEARDGMTPFLMMLTLFIPYFLLRFRAQRKQLSCVRN